MNDNGYTKLYLSLQGKSGVWSHLARQIYGPHKGNDRFRRKLYALWRVKKSKFRDSVLAEVYGQGPVHRAAKTSPQTSKKEPLLSTTCTVKMHRVPSDTTRDDLQVSSSSDTEIVEYDAAQAVPEEQSESDGITSEFEQVSGKCLTMKWLFTSCVYLFRTVYTMSLHCGTLLAMHKRYHMYTFYMCARFSPVRFLFFCFTEKKTG